MPPSKKKAPPAEANEPKPPTYAVESVNSALKILRMLCESKEIRLSEVAERLGVAHSTAHRLLSMLVYHGFAIQERRGGEYRTGPAALDMGLAAMRDLDLRQHARPVLEDLRKEVNETVHIGMLYGQQVMYIDGAESTHALKLGARTGAFVPAHCVALGKAILATFTPKQLRTRAGLERQLEEVRRAGFAASLAESVDGVGSIAVAILDRDGVARAAISVGAPLTRMSPQAQTTWVAAAKVAAATLRARLWGAPALVKATAGK
jgi:IclR family acetate operon transcriptional repressor